MTRALLLAVLLISGPADATVWRTIEPGEWVILGAGDCELDVLDLPLEQSARGQAWELYAYRGGAYVAVDVVEPGEGAWLIHVGPDPIRFAPL